MEVFFVLFILGVGESGSLSGARKKVKIPKNGVYAGGFWIL